MRSLICLQATGQIVPHPRVDEGIEQHFSTTAMGRGIFLIGDLGFEAYASGSQYYKEPQKQPQAGWGTFPKVPVGFSNIGSMIQLL